MTTSPLPTSSLRLRYFAGWDWVGGTPDRNTGILGDVLLRSTGPVALRDPVMDVTLTAPVTDPAVGVAVNASVTVALLNLDPTTAIVGTLTLTIPELGALGSVSLVVNLTAEEGVWQDVTLPTLLLPSVEVCGRQQHGLACLLA